MDKAKNHALGAFLLLVFMSATSLGQEPVDYANIAERFSEYNDESKTKIDHYPFSFYLNNTVLYVGRSRGFLGNEKPELYRNSKVKIAQSLTPARFENSRVLFHMFADEHRNFFLEYQAGLEALSEARPLKKFNRDEQLAYWLNLYNVIVMNKLAKEYPIAKLSGLRDDDPNAVDFWNEKTTVVEGIPLSLRDIEKILFTNFNSPLVAFGLWQGTIGGPRLRNLAYTGETVWKALENNAVEFVNSNRGLRPPRGSKLKVSEFYQWTLANFGTSPDDVLAFIKRYADPNFVTGVENVDEISFSVYDWQIADVLGGTVHSGQYNQMGGVLTGQSGNTGDVGAGGAIGGLMDFYKMTDSAQRGGKVGQLPDVFYNLLIGMRQNTRRPVPVITTEECAPGEECKPAGAE